MHIETLDIEAVFDRLHTRPEGLSSSQVQKRQAEHGLNLVERVEGESMWRVFLGEFTHFFALILWAAVALSTFAAWQQPDEGMGTLAVAIAAVILVNGVFSFWQRYKAEQTLAELERLLPAKVSVKRAGRVEVVDAAQIVPGDVLLLDAGERVPADCRLIESFDLRVNNATVTGESMPLSRTASPSTASPSKNPGVLEADNIALAGTVVVSGKATAVAFATGKDTELGAIAHQTGETIEGASPLTVEIERISRFVTVVAVSLGVIFFFVAQSLGLALWQRAVIAIGIIVGLVPEGLLPTVSLSLAFGSRRMARRNAVVRHLPAVEALGAASVICTDKTGTLTQNRMQVHTLEVGGERHAIGEDLANLGALARRLPAFFDTALFSEAATPEQVGHPHESLGDPMELALIEMAEEALEEVPEGEKIDEVPFDPDRKRLSTVFRRGHETVVYTKGALESLLPLSTHEQTFDGLRPLDDSRASELLAHQEQLASQGLRVLALAFRQVPGDYDREHLEEELTLLGLVGLEDPPRVEVAQAISDCHRAGIAVIMVTGDHPTTAAAIACRLGLIRGDHPQVITGAKLRAMSDTELMLALEHPDVHFARLDPGQKVRIVSALQNKGHVVAVTGDGVNDAPALKKGDIGIAMGKGGTDAAREASDIVLADDNFATIVAAVAEGRAVFANIRKFLTYIFSSNVAEMMPFLVFVLLKVPLPLPVLLVLAIDLGTDMIPALGLGAEEPEPSVMDHPPHRPGEHLLDKTVVGRAFGLLGPLEGVAGLVAYFGVLFQSGWSYGETLGRQDPVYLQATTACFAAIVVMQVVNLVHCRDDTTSSLRYGLSDNRVLWAGLVFEVAVLVAMVYVPFAQELFATAPLAAHHWLWFIPMAALFWAIEEVRKFVVRRRRDRLTARRPQALNPQGQ